MSRSDDRINDIIDRLKRSSCVSAFWNCGKCLIFLILQGISSCWEFVILCGKVGIKMLAECGKPISRFFAYFFALSVWDRNDAFDIFVEKLVFLICGKVRKMSYKQVVKFLFPHFFKNIFQQSGSLIFLGFRVLKKGHFCIFHTVFNKAVENCGELLEKWFDFVCRIKNYLNLFPLFSLTLSAQREKLSKRESAKRGFRSCESDKGYAPLTAQAFEKAWSKLSIKVLLSISSRLELGPNAT